MDKYIAESQTHVNISGMRPFVQAPCGNHEYELSVKRHVENEIDCPGCQEYVAEYTQKEYSMAQLETAINDKYQEIVPVEGRNINSLGKAVNQAFDELKVDLRVTTITDFDNSGGDAGYLLLVKIDKEAYYSKVKDGAKSIGI